MAVWTTIPDENIEPDKPIRSIDGLALRDNPVAIAEGAAGAPRIQSAGINWGSVNSDIGRQQVRIGSASTSGFIGNINRVSITLNRMSFFPMIQSDNNEMVLATHPTLSAASAPRFAVRNLSVTGTNWNVRHEYINA
jgi:hypothetical protein